MSQIIDAATRTLQQTATAAQKSIGQLAASIEGQVAEMQTNQNKIADQIAEIEANDKRIESEVRSAAAEIRLQVKEDRKAVLCTLLTEEGLVATTQAEIDASNDRIEEAELKAARTEFEAVKAVETKLHANYKAQIAEINAENKVQLATFTANAARDADLINALRAQVAGLEETIKANREAETARTTALAQSSVTVNNGK